MVNGNAGRHDRSGVLYMTVSSMVLPQRWRSPLNTHPERRGQVIATYSMAYPLSAGVGSLLAGSAIQMPVTPDFIFIALLNSRV